MNLTGTPITKWQKIALVLVLLTILDSIIEGLIALWLGYQTESIALGGFGFDSMIEVSASGAFLWRLLQEMAGADAEAVAAKERFARRFIGGTFLVLAAYILVESGSDLWGRHAPEASRFGVLLALASIIVMPLLVRAKLRVAKEINSEALTLEAKETLCCFYLSVILLIGLGLNLWLGWWWADPVGALVMIPWLIREGLEALQGESCCQCHQSCGAEEATP